MDKHPLSEREIVSAKNRPDMRKRKKGVLVADGGFSGWARRDLRTYKGNVREADFHHLYSKFADPSEVEED